MQIRTFTIYTQEIYICNYKSKHSDIYLQMFKYALCNKPHNILETNSLYIFINKTATKK